MNASSFQIKARRATLLGVAAAALALAVAGFAYAGSPARAEPAAAAAQTRIASPVNPLTCPDGRICTPHGCYCI